uniref:Uncharacterized protein n=1 Tax=Panagrolaimus davidi TaxID=227884 RepID=A0A914PCH2_9BILA
MPKIPFAHQWIIPESRLISLKDCENGCLHSDFVSNIPGFKYYLTIFPNEKNYEQRKQTCAYLHVILGNVKKVEADFTLKIDSANFSFKNRATFEESRGHGPFVADAKDFFDPEKKFIFDGQCIIKIYGTFEFETDEKSTSDYDQRRELVTELWEDRDSKDFTLNVWN